MLATQKLMMHCYTIWLWNRNRAIYTFSRVEWSAARELRQTIGFLRQTHLTFSLFDRACGQVLLVCWFRFHSAIDWKQRVWALKRSTILYGYRIRQFFILRSLRRIILTYIFDGFSLKVLAIILELRYIQFSKNDHYIFRYKIIDANFDPRLPVKILQEKSKRWIDTGVQTNENTGNYKVQFAIGRKSALPKKSEATYTIHHMNARAINGNISISRREYIFWGLNSSLDL